MSAISIAERVGAMRAARPAGPESAFDREQRQLAQIKPEGIIAVGERLPDAELLDVEGRATTLLEQLGGRQGVLVFYRGVWCPFCNVGLNAYQADLLPALNERGVELLAVSPQKPDGSLSMKEKNDLEFAVVSDPGNQLAAAAGILTAPSDEALAAQLEHGLVLTAVNADGTTTLPMPTVAIVDAQGTVIWIDVRADYSTRTEPTEILAALDALAA
jgi:peroxiredoxin